MKISDSQCDDEEPIVIIQSEEPPCRISQFIGLNFSIGSLDLTAPRQRQSSQTRD